MLGKLIGYETKAFGRIMLPLYGAMLAFALFTGLSIRFLPEDIMQGLPGVLIFMLYTFLMLAIIIMTCVLSVTRFYKNLLGEEGYLMFSLPTDTATLIASKVISVVIWSTLSAIVAVLSIALSVLGAGGIEPFRDIIEFMSYPEIVERLPSVLGVTTMTVLIIIISVILAFLFWTRLSSNHLTGVDSAEAAVRSSRKTAPNSINLIIPVFFKSVITASL